MWMGAIAVAVFATGVVMGALLMGVIIGPKALLWKRMADHRGQELTVLYKGINKMSDSEQDALQATIEEIER